MEKQKLIGTVSLINRKAILIPVIIALIAILSVSRSHAQVHNRTSTSNYTNISDALIDASPGDLIEVDDGIYYESITINVSGITLRATSWTQSGDNTSAIIDSTGMAGLNTVTISMVTNVVLQGFTIQNSEDDGLQIQVTKDVEIRNCNILTNELRGIRVESINSTNLLIHSNTIAFNDLTGMVIAVDSIGSCTVSYNNFCSNFNLGILNRGNNCLFISNRIYYNADHGAEERGIGCEWIDNIIYDNYNNGVGISFYKAYYSTISGNIIYNNGHGMNFRFISSNITLTNNIIYSNNNAGIQILPNRGMNTVIVDNTIYGNIDGIRVYTNAGVVIKRNIVSNSSFTGIDLMDMTNGVIALNTVKQSGTGVIVSGNVLPTFIKNNIFSNTVNLSNQTASLLVVTNHWWGTTIESDIDAAIDGGTGGYNASNYRLFGEFDISEGADTDRVPAITWVESFSNTNPYGIGVIWKKPVTTSNFSRYFVYRSTIPGTTNLSSANIIARINNISITNFFDVNISFATQYYYHVTSLDDHPVYTNESWYSVESVSVGPKIIRNIAVEKLAKISLNNVIYNRIKPGYTITYSNWYSNTGNMPVTNIIIRDKIPQALEYIIGSTNDTGNFKPAWSQSNTPIQAYNSADYNDTESSPVKWIRWTNTSIPIGSGSSADGALKFSCYFTNSTLSAGTLLANISIRTGKDLTLFYITNTVTVGTLYGGRFSVTGDATNLIGNTNYFTISFTNKGNIIANFLLNIPYTNSSTSNNYFEISFVTNDTEITQIENIQPGSNFSFQVRTITTNSKLTNMDWVDIRVMAQVENNNTATNYTGDDSVEYGGDIGEDQNGNQGANPGGIYHQTNPEIRLTITGFPVLNIVKSIESISIDGVGSDIIPGSTIEYKLFCTNTGSESANNVLIYDIIPGYAIYSSNSATNNTTGWTNEWSTNLSPDQSWESGDYTNIEPVSTNIRWIRWRKQTFEIDESIDIYYKVIVN